MKNILYLASQSFSRKSLLIQTGISFEVFKQSADEHACDWTLPLEQLVESIALHKMESLDMSGINDKQKIWILTADTLGQDEQGNIYGKPQDYDDAVVQLKKQRNQWARVATNFCLERKVYLTDRWRTDKRISQTIVSSIYFAIEDAEIDAYIKNSGALQCAGSITVDGYGAQHLKEVKGSYSNIIGLPLYEVRQALKELGFFND